MARADFFTGKSGGTKAQVDVSSLMTAPVIKSMVRVIECGALLSIGTTRDRGAMSVTVTHDSEYVREYFREVDELVMWLAKAYEAVSDGEDEAPSAAPAPRRRHARR